MNVLVAEIEEITVKGSLSLVKLKAGEEKLSAIVIDTPITSDYLKKGNPVKVIFKETEVIIGDPSISRISLQNKIPGEINSIESNGLLSKITINTSVGMITAVITNNAVSQLQLAIGSMITAMIKTNEMMLSA